MCLTLVPVTVLADDDIQQINDAAVQAITPGSDVSVLSVVPDTDAYRTYKFYSGETLLSEQIVKNGDTLLEPEVPTQDGKVFTGWDNKDVHFGTISGITATETIMVNAQFDEGYHVTFLTTDGSVLCTAPVTPNGTLTDLPDEVKNYQPAGKRVTAWKSDNGEFTTSTVVTGDITLTPDCVDCYWVTFDTQGGSGVPSQYVDQGNTLTLANVTTPTRTGYTFKGWSLTQNGETVAFVTPTADTTLYAIWEASGVKYTVAYWGENANDDKFETFLGSEEKYAPTGTRVSGGKTLPTSITNRNYFTYKDSDTATVKADGSTVINVRCTRNKYTVAFDLGLASNKSMTVAGKTYTGGWNAEKYTLTAKFEQNIEDLWPTASNFTSGSNFRGWSVSGFGNTILTSKRITMTADLCNSDGKTATANYGAKYTVHLYYMFESFEQTSPTSGNDRKYYNGKYYDKSTVYSQDAMSNKPTFNQKTITGMKPVGVVSERIGGRDSTEYNNFLYYDRLSYELTWNNYGSTTTDTLKYGAQLTNKGTPARPAGFSEYATFKGWYTVPVAQITNTTVPFDFTGKTMPASNMTLFAYWVEAQIKVTFIVGDKSFEASIPYGTKAASADAYGTAITAISASGKTLLKWVDNTTGSAVDVNQQLYTNTTLRAVFKGDTHKVTYVVTPGTGSVTDDRSYEYDALAVVKSGSGITLPANKVFLGWTTVAGGATVTKYPGSTVQMKDQDITLYAVYGDKASTVQLTYKPNGGKEADITETDIPNNKQVTLRDENTFTRTGYHFTGWNTEANGTGTSFSAGAPARVDNLGSGSGNVLYAQWAPNTDTKYTVEFYYQKDDGSYPSTASKTELRTGTTDATVSVTDADKEAKENGKYVYDTTAANVESGPVAADGSLVLKLYFKLNQADVTVNYYWNETTNEVATSKTLPAQTVGTSVTESPIAIEGYTAVSNASQTITIDVSDNVINFYYYKNVELTANSKTETYDGTEKSVSGYTGAPADADFSAITVGAKGTNVGTYPANFADDTEGTVDTNKKYIVTKANNGQLTITANATAIVVKIKGNTLTKTYDGNEYTVEGYDVVSISDTRYTATDFSFTGTAEAKGTNVRVGGYSMGLTAAQFTNTSENFSNVKFEVTDGKLTINPRNVTLTSESGEKEYDGTPLTKPNVTVGGDGFVTGEVTDIKATGSVTYVSDGEVTNTITYTTGEKFNAGNYNISKSEGKLKITDRTAKYEITVKANSGEKTYDGTALNVSGFENLEFTVDGQKYTVSGLTAYKTGTNVSDSGAVVVEGTAVVKDANDNDVTSQFNVNTEDGQLTINPRTVTLTSGDGKKEYDGTPLTNKTVSVTGDGFVTGEGATYDVTGTITNVADNEANNNTFTYTLNEGTTAGNYVIEIMYGTLEITPVAAEVTVTIKGNTTDAVYDATEKTAEGYDVISISNELYTANDFALTGKDKVTGIAAGEYDMGLAFENISKNFSKVTFVVEDGKLTIAKRDVTVTGESATKVYNGQTQEINGYTVDNLVKGHEMTGVIYSAKGKDPGKYDGSFTGRQIVIKDAAGTDVTKNYNVKPVIGVLTITQPSRPTRPSTPTKDVTSVKTADGSQMTLWMSMMLASAAGIVFLGKKRKEEQ